MDLPLLDREYSTAWAGDLQASFLLQRLPGDPAKVPEEPRGDVAAEAFRFRSGAEKRHVGLPASCVQHEVILRPRPFLRHVVIL